MSTYAPRITVDYGDSLLNFNDMLMARMARLMVPSYAHHITQRGRGRTLEAIRAG